MINDISSWCANKSTEQEKRESHRFTAGLITNKINRLVMIVAKKYPIDFIELCSLWMTATDENVVRPPANPGIRASRINSEVFNL